MSDSQPVRAAQRRPNILLITTDQQRYDALGANGNEVVQSPNIDALARRGVRFSRAFVQNTVCVPSRACIQTGRYTHQHGVRYMEGNVDDTPGLGVWETTFMERLQAAGYRTGAVGKIHMYPARGFDWTRLTGGKGHRWTRPYGQEIGPGPLGNEYAAWLERRHPGGYEKMYEQRRAPEYTEHHGAIVNVLPLEDYVESWTTENAVAFLDESRDADRPFFLWCGFCGPHGPMDPPESHARLYRPQDMPVSPLFCADTSDKPRMYRKASIHPDQQDIIRLITARYYALVSLIDDMVGRILEALQRNGQLDNTLIAFTSDHGEMLGDFGRFGKTVFHDGVIRVPLIPVPPAGEPVQPATVLDGLTEVMDLCPTILDYARAAIPDEIQAVSVRQRLEAGAGGADDILSEFTGADRKINGKCLRTDRYKYICWTDDIGEFYDLREDPLERRNLWRDPDSRDLVQEHERLLLQRLLKSERPILPR